MLDNILNNIRYGVELERAQMPDNGLNESPGLMNSLLGGISGATPTGVDNKRTAVQSSADKREYGALYEVETGKKWKPGLTANTALAEIRQAKDTRQDTKDTTAFNRSLKPLEMQMEATREENRANRQSQDNQFAFSTKIEGMRMGHQAEQADLNRSLERTLSNNSNDLQMQMSFMNADLEEKRMDYDRETRRMDRRDRMIANLMSGIGQLGAGFAA